MQVAGPKVGAIIFQIQGTDRRGSAGYTPVEITGPASGRPKTAISLTHTVSADITYDIVQALPDCQCSNCPRVSCKRLTLAGLTRTAAVRPWGSFIDPYEGKGVWTVTTQYRPSGRAEDQKAGAVGAAGAWPVRPAALAAAPGKMSLLSIAHTISYVYIVCIHRMFQSICT